MDARLEAAEGQPLLTSKDRVDANSMVSKSVDPYRKLNFVSKHWRGEYSLARSFWLHGVIFCFLLFEVSSLLVEEIRFYPSWLFYGMFGIGIWQIGGVSRSAKQRGGFWARAATFSIALLFLGCMSDFNDMLKDQLRRLEIEHQQHASSAPPARPLIPADKPDAVKTQPWKQVGEWDVRYDNSDSGDGAPNGCFMARIYGHSGLRIGFHGPAKDYAVMFTSETLIRRIEDQKSYNLSLRFGNLSPWSIDAAATILGSSDKRMLLFRAGDQRFLAELVSNNSLTISQSGTPIFELTVTGAKEALAAMLNCQESHRHNPHKAS
jgi:hypothetical protein